MITCIRIEKLDGEQVKFTYSDGTIELYPLFEMPTDFPEDEDNDDEF